MPSDRRLHPLSMLFGIGGYVRELALPWLLGLVTAGVAGWAWQLWLPLLLIPLALRSIGHWLSFRYRFEAAELVIRSGLLFRTERHIPYARIQNLDGLQEVLHRLLKVVEVRVQTGGGQEPEAVLRVVPMGALHEMRQRVLGGPKRPMEPTDETAGTSPPERVLLRLSPRELVLSGLIHDRGLVVLAAALGLLWEFGLLDRLLGLVAGQHTPGRGLLRDLLRAMFAGGDVPLGRVAWALAAIAGGLVVLRLISIVWAIVRLHGYRLTRTGADLRADFGLLTRVATTIPLRRIQTLTIQEGPVHRWSSRVSVRVQTAGGAGGEDRHARCEWLAPIVRRDRLADLLREVTPELDLAAVAWQRADPRALRRVLRENVLVAFVLAVPFAFLLGWWDLALLAVLLGWAVLNARLYVAHYGWAVTDEAVLFRSGWLHRQVTSARFSRVQSVAMHESPFDRRAAMARIKADTAGAGSAPHRVDIPYLSKPTAEALFQLLGTRTAQTRLRW